jgi:hypothetical protein
VRILVYVDDTVTILDDTHILQPTSPIIPPTTLAGSSTGANEVQSIVRALPLSSTAGLNIPEPTSPITPPTTLGSTDLAAAYDLASLSSSSAENRGFWAALRTMRARQPTRVTLPSQSSVGYQALWSALRAFDESDDDYMHERKHDRETKRDDDFD